MLLESIQRVLAPEKREAFARLRAAWRARNLQAFAEAMQLLAAQLATLATDRETIEKGAGVSGLAQETRRLAASIAGKPAKDDPASERAMAQLAARAGLSPLRIDRVREPSTKYTLAAFLEVA